MAIQREYLFNLVKQQILTIDHLEKENINLAEKLSDLNNKLNIYRYSHRLKICLKCEIYLDENSNFCNKCGTQIEFVVSEENNELTIIDYIGTKNEVFIPSKIGGKSVVSIGYKAFWKKYLSSIVIPNSITYIGKQAFERNNLTRIIIPYGVVEIDKNSFNNNYNLSSVDIPDSVELIGDFAFCHNKLTNVSLPSKTKVGYRAFDIDEEKIIYRK